ncbi:MAG: L,D-transpeptidase family protein [bacterium]|nr:L,D-transpeptidase family protein [bacterium]
MRCSIKHYQRGFFAAASLLLTLALGGTSFAATATGPALLLEKKQEEPFSYLSDSALAEADQVFLVLPSQAESQAKHRADFYWYSKTQNTWEFKTKTEATVGRNGISRDKKEGDGMTPSGTYGFLLAFGIKENPDSLLPYHQVQHGDVWVDDRESSYYNRLINRTQTPTGWNSGEVLENYAPDYNYALALDYNSDCVPNKGSAIFLHCVVDYDRGSSGCICIPEDIMKEILQTATEKTRIVIIPSEA